eukprot:2361683-Pyramimonas_sp.AAC.1
MPRSSTFENPARWPAAVDYMLHCCPQTSPAQWLLDWSCKGALRMSARPIPSARTVAHARKSRTMAASRNCQKVASRPDIGCGADRNGCRQTPARRCVTALGVDCAAFARA